MNKTLVALNVILLIAVGYLFIDRFSGGKNGNDELADEIVADGNDTTIQELDTNNLDTIQFDFGDGVNLNIKNAKIAYIHLDSLNANVKYLQNVKKQGERMQGEVDSLLRLKETNLMNKLKSMQNSFQRDVKAFQEKAPVMVQSDAQAEQAKLAKRQENILRKEQEYALEMEQFKREKLIQLERFTAENQKRLYDYVSSATQQFAKANNIDYVMGYQEGAQIFSLNEAYDITQYIIDAINKKVN